MGHSGVRADIDVSGALDWPGLPGRAVAKQGGEERESERELRAAHLRIILANCVHVSVHSTLGLSSEAQGRN